MPHRHLLTALFSVAIAATGVSCATTPTPMPMPESVAIDDGATVELRRISATSAGDESVGTVSLADGTDGLVLTPNLRGLPPGPKGFHVHVNADCGPALKGGVPTAGEAAGPHYDPAATGRHAGPEGMGHEGDLPRLLVAADGTATTPVTVSRLSLAEARGHALIVHAGDDDYGPNMGGARMACGVIR